MRIPTCSMSCDALSAKAPSLPLSTCDRDETLLAVALLCAVSRSWKAQLGNYQERHSMPLLLLYLVCQSPCHWLQVKVCQ